MQRTVLERSVVDGFRGSRVESLVSTAYGRKIFVATSDGSITAYTCSLESNSAGRLYVCKEPEMFRKPSKDKKSCAPLIAADTWRIILCIADGILTAYDSQFHQPLNSIADSKGCHTFAIHEKSSSVILANKKKLSHYTWLAPGFNLRKEFNLSDVPKAIFHIAGSAIVGYKKYYELLDLNTGTTSRLLDIDREHKLIVLEVPGGGIRRDSVLLSIGTQGLLIDTDALLAGGYVNPSSPTVDRIEFSSQPVAVHVMSPFLLTVLGDAIEVHDLLTLVPLQKIPVTSTNPLTCTVLVEDVLRGLASNSPFAYHAFVCNGEQLLALRMSPLPAQVNHLVANGCFEEAINLCKLTHTTDKKDINLMQLHESCANTLMNRGDFPKAVEHFLAAGTAFLIIAKQFPDFIPLPMHVMFGIQQAKRLTSSTLQRAAYACVTCCLAHRPKMIKRAERAEKMKELGIIAASSLMANSYKNKQMDYEDDEDYIADPDEELRKCQLLDSMLLFALMHCTDASGTPDRRADVLTLLSAPNRCQIETCSVLLASHGNTYTEALLWLYRSQGQHTRVLQALTEDKCVALGAWTREQFYGWTADYLRWLWYQEEDATLPRQALLALKPVLEYDSELGLSVLVSRPANKSSFGGKGVTIGEVLAFLRSCSPQVNYSQSRANKQRWQMEKGIAQVLSSLSLVNGHALAVAFLECLLSSGEAPPSLHDDFSQLLVEGILQAGVPPSTPLDGPDDSGELGLYKTYRKKLQAFLGASHLYHPQKILKLLSSDYYLENALILAKLGRHREVLSIYLTAMRKVDLAEGYCERIYTAMQQIKSGQANFSHKKGMSSTAAANAVAMSNLAASLANPSEIYLIMFQVILDEDEDEGLPMPERIQMVIGLAEKYFDRFETSALLELLLPRDVSIAQLLHYFQTVLEYGNAKQRNLQIVHHLLRVREVAMRTPEFGQGK